MPKGTYTESIILNAGHALIMSHKPDKIRLTQVNKKLEEEPQDVQQFGLFDSATPNYTTYYPEVTEEDLNPDEKDFIEPVFRMLSNVTVHAAWNPIHFPARIRAGPLTRAGPGPPARDGPIFLPLTGLINATP